MRRAAFHDAPTSKPEVYLRDHAWDRAFPLTEWAKALRACKINLRHRCAVSNAVDKAELPKTAKVRAGNVVVFLHADPELRDQWIDAVEPKRTESSTPKEAEANKLPMRTLVLVSRRGISDPTNYKKVRACQFTPERFRRTNAVVAKFLEKLGL
jgi:hypothetical protein